jgi:hypothetical protein
MSSRFSPSSATSPHSPMRRGRSGVRYVLTGALSGHTITEAANRRLTMRAPAQAGRGRQARCRQEQPLYSDAMELVAVAGCGAWMACPAGEAPAPSRAPGPD